MNLNTIAAAYRDLQSEGLITVKRGSGATVVARTSGGVHSQEDLRRPIRTALTDLVLAGMPKREILTLVIDELRGLLKGVKS